jgi:hypothetical protein
MICTAAAALAFGSVGCGGGGDETASQQELKQAYREGQQEARDRSKQRHQDKQLKELREQLRDLKDGDGGDGGESRPAPPETAPPAPQTVTPCGSGVGAGPNTSCPFALSVANRYYESGGQTMLRDVYSSTTGDYYTMTCDPGGPPTICRGGNSASVYVP